MHRINEVTYSLLPIAIVGAGLAGLIVLEPDYGTAMSLLTIVAVMVFAAGLSYRYILVSALVAIPALLALLLAEGYRRDRILAFLDPWSVRQDEGWQIVQSFIAIGTGGIFGRGLFESTQKLLFLPEPHNDFIYAVIGEELGLVGTTAILACYCVIAWRGLQISAKAEDRFGSLLALGITMMIAAQNSVPRTRNRNARGIPGARSRAVISPPWSLPKGTSRGRRRRQRPASARNRRA